MERLPPHLLVLGEEWKARSKELAEWAWERLVNGKDVWGQDTSLSAREKLDSRKSCKALTLPQKKCGGRTWSPSTSLPGILGACAGIT
jgi:hypothetical protein